MDKTQELPFLAADDVLTARYGDTVYTDLAARQTVKDAGLGRVPAGRFIGVDPLTRKVTALVPSVATMLGAPPPVAAPVDFPHWVCRPVAPPDPLRRRPDLNPSACVPSGTDVMTLGAPSSVGCECCGKELQGHEAAQVSVETLGHLQGRYRALGLKRAP